MTTISVLIPVYNAQKYIVPCIDSLSQQTFADFEIICLNDGSTDNSAEVLQQLAVREKRLKIITQKNSGVAVARNRLIQEAQGKYIAFVDADDKVLPSYLEKLYAAAEKEQADISKCFFQEIDENDKCSSANCSRRFYTRPDDTLSSRFSAGYHDSVVWGKLFCRTFLVENKLHFRPGHVAEDLPFVVQAFMSADRIVYVPEPLYLYRKGISGAITANSQKMAVDLLSNLIDLAPQLRARDKWDAQVAHLWIKSVVWSVARFHKFPPEFCEKHRGLIRQAWTAAEQEIPSCTGLARGRWRTLFGLVKLCGAKSMIFWSRCFR